MWLISNTLGLDAVGHCLPAGCRLWSTVAIAWKSSSRIPMVSAVPAQIVDPVDLLRSTVETAAGGVRLLARRARIEMRDLPRCSRRARRWTEDTRDRAIAGVVSSADSRVTLENELYRLALDPRNGAITSLRLRNNDWEVLESCLATSWLNILRQDRGAPPGIE